MVTLVSPSGRRINRNTTAPDVSRVTGATTEHVEVANPEPGTWTAELFGVDVAPAGEETSLSVYQADPENQRPVGRINARVVNNSLVLAGSRYTDSDGTITSYDWYITTPTVDDVKQGASITVPLASASERTFTLVVTDRRGATDFTDLAWVPLDVMPGSSVNPIKLTSNGVTPIAVLSTSTFDATTVSPTTMRVGPMAAQVKETTAVKQDVNGDGRMDQVVHVVTTRLGLTQQSTQLCLSMTLPNGRAASSCDAIRAQ